MQLWLFFHVKIYFKGVILMLLIDLKTITIFICEDNPGLYNIMWVTVKHAIFDHLESVTLF